MSVVALEFLVPLLLSAAVFFHVPAARWRQIALAGLNALFLYFCIHQAASWVLLGVLVVSGYLVAAALKSRPSATLLAGYVSALVAVFLVLRKYEILERILPAQIWNSTIETLGLSYLLFRQIHFLVDVMQEQIPEFSLWSYLNYQLNLFGFLSGPIQRYQEFHAHWTRLEPILTTRHEVMRAFMRLLVGVVKFRISLMMLTYYNGERDWFAYPSLGYFGHLDEISVSRLHTLVRFGVVFYGYLIYLYFNFSGYCDVVIAGAALLGLKMPENFDRPYLSRNILDYWTRFHRTLGFWIRDYLFTPTYKLLAERWPDRSAILVYPCYLTAFILAGMWHGSTNNFALFGLLHGIGICAVKGWETILIKTRGRKALKGYLASTAIRVIAIVVTLNFVCFTMLFFPNSSQVAVAVMREFAHRMMR
jgi:D-alanyl-lipoteichoic acid acyltransferase DltB (MBOAT superfamily)